LSILYVLSPAQNVSVVLGKMNLRSPFNSDRDVRCCQYARLPCGEVCSAKSDERMEGRENLLAPFLLHFGLTLRMWLCSTTSHSEVNKREWIRVEDERALSIRCTDPWRRLTTHGELDVVGIRGSLVVEWIVLRVPFRTSKRCASAGLALNPPTPSEMHSEGGQYGRGGVNHALKKGARTCPLRRNLFAARPPGGLNSAF